jgi:hypothetical protein
LLDLVDEILCFTWLAIVNQSQSIKSGNLTVGHTGCQIDNMTKTARPSFFWLQIWPKVSQGCANSCVVVCCIVRNEYSDSIINYTVLFQNRFHNFSNLFSRITKSESL